MTVAEEIAAPNWRCLRCDVWNAPDGTCCMVCETDRATATDASALVPLTTDTRPSDTGRRGPTPNPRGRPPSTLPPAPRTPPNPAWPGAPPGPRPGVPWAPPHPAGLGARPAAPSGPDGATGEVFFPPVASPRPPMAPPWAPGGPSRGLPPHGLPPRGLPPYAGPRPGMRPPGQVPPVRQISDLVLARSIGIGCGVVLLLFFLVSACAAVLGSSSGTEY